MLEAHRLSSKRKPLLKKSISVSVGAVSLGGQSDKPSGAEKAAQPAVCGDSLHAQKPRLERDQLASAGLDVQRAALIEVVFADSDLMAILQATRELEIPDCWLTAGAVYQTVWNRLTGMPRRHGIKDYDVCYFDAEDISPEAQHDVGKRLHHYLLAHPSLESRAAASLRIDCVNQARVHLWFEEEFGFAIPPFERTSDSLPRYAGKHHAVAVQLDPNGELRTLHPFGLDDVFGMRIRPNRLFPNQATHRAKGARAQALWPGVTVEEW